MRNYFLILFLLIIKLSLGQKEKIDSILNNYKSSENFRSTLELAQDASTISGTKFFDYHSGIKKAYLFHGDFSLPFTMGGEDYISGRKRAFFHSFQLLLGSRIRIFQNDQGWNDKSKPVRTPSFNPKLYYFLTNQHFWNDNRKLYCGLGIGHHSNGQDGTEFVDFSDTVNIYNGSFSESLINYGLIGGNFSMMSEKFRYEGNKAKKNRSTFALNNSKVLNINWKLGFEYHPPYFANQKFYQSGVYGGNRIFGNIQLLSSKTFSKNFGPTYKKNKETNRLTLNFEYITDLSYYSGGFNHLEEIKLTDVQKRLNVNLTYYRRILNSKHPALFAQLAYYGSDNYNIYFQKSTFQARIGIAFGFFKYEKTER